MSTSASTTPWFGRAWSLTVTTQAGQQLSISNSAWEPESLRMTFTVEQVAGQAWWFADIAIYNLNSVTEQFLLGGADGFTGTQGTTSSANIEISQNDVVTLTAGYQSGDGAAGPIFEGRVFQALYDRLDGTDFVLTLHSIVSDDQLAVLSTSVGPLATQAGIVKAMAAQAHLNIESLDEQSFNQAQLPRARAIFGTPGDYLRQIAASNQLRYWMSDHGLNLVGSGNPQTTPSLIYGPSATQGSPVQPTDSTNYTPTLIGVPQQTQGGIVFRILLDPRIRVGQLVGIDQSVIRQIPQYPLQTGPTVLSQDGTYYVGAVKFTGDTRGNNWYSDVTGLTPLAWQSALLQVSGGQSQ